MASSAKNPPLFPLATALVLAAALYFFPLFHVVRLDAPASHAPAAFDPAAAALKIWQADLPGAAARAVDLKSLVGPLRNNPAAAAKQFGHAADLGAMYYFVRGRGRVVARERNVLRLAVDGGESAIVALRIGPVFGNTVRDGCGFLDVNAFPGLAEFNALSAELNALVEKKVLPVLREKAAAGAMVDFAGCAEAPDSAPDPGEPLLTIVPVQAEVR